MANVPLVSALAMGVTVLGVGAVTLTAEGTAATIIAGSVAPALSTLVTGLAIGLGLAVGVAVVVGVGYLGWNAWGWFRGKNKANKNGHQYNTLDK